MAFSTINKSTLYQNQVLYTGNGGTQSITGVGFQPDFTWLKKRNASASNNVFDAVRGSDIRLITDDTSAEVTQSNFITSFNSDGFSIGDDAPINSNTNTFVGWNWKANGTGSANTDGSISSTVSANTTSGFSIVSYTGTGANATVGHGLGVAPAMFIIKNRTSSSNTWTVYNKNLADATKFLGLNTTAAVDTSAANFNSTAPTSSFFYVGTDAGTNGSTTMIAYCFAEISGYSKFGSYTGNGNADGTFIYTGFKPSFVIIKGAISGDGDAAQSWELYDNKRLGYNVDNNNIKPNTTAAESTGDRVDLLSNGFKIRVNSDGVNDNNSTYIYMAFGQPIVSNSGVPANAR